MTEPDLFTWRPPKPPRPPRVAKPRTPKAETPREPLPRHWAEDDEVAMLVDRWAEWLSA
ncbi:MAG: hypothetical protein KGL39_30440 [Patescibacteria group bacterium]|nr:hypothetical protein [Patescibacteria group bacterium]